MGEPVVAQGPKRRRLYVLLGLYMALAGCGGSERDPGWAGSEVDSAGVLIVTSPAAGVWSSGETWSVQEELRIGSFGRDPRYQFAQIGSIALTSVGHLVVMDRQTREVREFTGGGEFVRSFGSPGKGPGEFGPGVTDVFVGPGDTLLIPDANNLRIHRFDPEGRFIDASPIDLTAHRPLRFLWNPATGIPVGQFRPNRNPDGGTPRSLMDELRPIGPDGGLGEPLLSLPAGGLFGEGGALQYFTPEPMWTVTDSLTVIYGINNKYRLRQYDRTGTLRRIIARDHEVRPITDRDIRAFFAYLDRAWLAAGVPPYRLRENHRRVSFAENFPVFFQIQSGPDGTLWVQTVRAPGDLSDAEIERYNFIEDFGGSDWDVFDRRGRYLGVVSMPSRFQPRPFAGDLIYGVARDEFDVQYVVRVRVIRGVTGTGSS
jgi:hypothetical protein